VKVGILTFHHAANYGAVWQCLSLSHAVRSIGHDVEVIDFRHPIAEKVYRSHLLRSRHAPFNLLKAWRLARDLRQGSKLSPVCYTSEELRKVASRYNAVIVGSDEVWNIEGMRGWTPAYFLDFVPDHVRKISYAASMGHQISVESHREHMQKLLRRFHAISVRDHTTAEIVAELTGNKPVVVVDPTLLDGRQPPLATKEHIALYGGLTKSVKQQLRQVGQSQRAQIVSIGFSNRVGGRIRMSAGLGEWLYTIGSARAVITTNFHGLLCSIVNERPFWVLPRLDGSTKVSQFVSAYGLQNRALHEHNMPVNMNFETSPDYASLWQRIDEQRDISRAFLARSLDISTNVQ
jgi:hypothetical protein